MPFDWIMSMLSFDPLFLVGLVLVLVGIALLIRAFGKVDAAFANVPAPPPRPTLYYVRLFTRSHPDARHVVGADDPVAAARAGFAHLCATAPCEVTGARCHVAEMTEPIGGRGVYRYPLSYAVYTFEANGEPVLEGA